LWRVPWCGDSCSSGGTALLAVAAILCSASRYRINTGQIDYAGRAAVLPQHPWGPLWNLWETQRFQEYRAAAEYLNNASRPDQVALISEVGVFGYYFKGEVLDSVGLCSPEALAFYPPPESDTRDTEGNSLAKADTIVPTLLVKELAPDFVVDSRVYVANLLQPGSWFLQEYTELAWFGTVWGEPLVIYKRME